MLSSKTLKKKKDKFVDEKQKVQKNSTVENMDKLVNIIAKARKQMQRYENENYIADKIKNIRRYINDDVINIINIKTKTENINDKLMRMLDFMEFDIESRVRVPNDSSSKANATDNNDTSSVHETLSPTQRCLNLPEKSPSADIREMDEINSAITALNHDLDYLELLQEADSGFSGYCSNVRLMIYNRLRLKKQILDIKLTKRRIERINDMFKRSKMVHSIKLTAAS
ncbi:unnamed protein product [Thelazia callipaeda]|uniref:BAG domain-containing protein n=1 Tax=Thelazia callipaeda TaxID=103827 RepID=A0A0N5CPI5_THECL|nr:unnamed protein product [Thelazia callipaeda]